MTRITIPHSLDAATAALGGLDKLLTAKEWERAAIVWAFTYEGKPGPKIAREVVRSTVADFARLKITGLKSQDSVRAYRRQWQRAIDEAGASDVKPGEKVTLPDLEWSWEGVSSQNERRFVAKDEESIARAIDRGDIDADVLASKLSDAPARKIVERVAEDRYSIVQRAQQDAVIRTFAKRRDIPGGAGPRPTGPGILPRLSALMKIDEACALIGVQAREIRRLIPELAPDEKPAVAEHLDHILGVIKLLHALAEGTTGLDDELANLLAEGRE